MGNVNCFINLQFGTNIIRTNIELVQGGRRTHGLGELTQDKETNQRGGGRTLTKTQTNKHENTNNILLSMNYEMKCIPTLYINVLNL